jgi:hypothetical protein
VGHLRSLLAGEGLIHAYECLGDEKPPDGSHNLLGSLGFRVSAMRSLLMGAITCSGV